MVDPNRKDFAVFETAAILLYLEKHYDPEHIFSWPSTDDKADDYRSEVLQWMFFIHGGVAPIQGNANHFFRYAPEKVPYGIERFQNEVKRTYGVLNSRLEGRDWLVGEGKGKYSIADANAFPWLYFYPWAMGSQDVPANVKSYIDRNWAIPAVKEGFKKPKGGELADKMWSPNFEEESKEMIKKRAEEAKAWIQSSNKAEAEKK